MSVLDAGTYGDIAECGVYKGGSARLLATIFKNKNILLFDSFVGMLENDTVEAGYHKIGHFNDTSLEAVKDYLKDKPNCYFYKGWLPDSATCLTDDTKFAFVHIDLDLYQSTKAAIEIFWPKLSDNGALVFDDWEFDNCPGVKTAILEYFGHNLQKYGFQHRNNMCVLYKI